MTTLHARLAELARLGATEHGIDRALFTPPERAARERFAAWARESGLRVEQDRAGNVFARLDPPNVYGSGGATEAPSEKSAELAPIQCGSHLDTVKDGGPLDGAYGVIAGLEALTRIAQHPRHPELVEGRARPAELVEARVTSPRPFEVVAWAGEEGSRFPIGTLGSSVYAGITPESALRDLRGDDGIAFLEARDGPCGLLPDVPVRDGFPPPAAYVELHIEQGPIMERVGARLGIVTAIAGQRRLAVAVDGTQGHAGTMPMRGRADALCAGSEIVLDVERAALEIGDCVATVGRLTVEPNGANVVPGRVEFRVDARSVEDARVDAIETRLRESSARVERSRGVRIAIEVLETRAAVPMDQHLRSLVADAARARDQQAIDVPSGAGHDAMCVARVAPVAMLFVPSIGGRSHVGDERTAESDLDLGVEVLTEILLAADRELAAASWLPQPAEREPRRTNR